MIRGRQTVKEQVINFAGREIIISEGPRLSFWADISHRCMTAKWPSFIAGASPRS